jgi:transcription antitermination factor NusG
MQVYISHSSRDKWAAHRISEDLISCGATTFLDEKDLHTGHSINESVKNLLKECDDFLILVSPASVKSEWVLIELGGAIALEKKIIPILLYVGANELPQIINLRLSRDINDIENYYSEVIKKVTGVPVTKESTKKKVTDMSVAKKKDRRKSSTFKKGDVVKIVSDVPDNIFKGPLLVDWEKDMNKFLGQTTKISLALGDETYHLEIDENDGTTGLFIFAEEWLIKL